MKKNILNRYEKYILKALYDEMGAPMSINGIAEETDMSWKTTKKYLEELTKDGLIKTYSRHKKPQYRLNTEEIFGFKPKRPKFRDPFENSLERSHKILKKYKERRRNLLSRHKFRRGKFDK